jgi:hypothetical protein
MRSRIGSPKARKRAAIESSEAGGIEMARFIFLFEHMLK